MFINSQEPIRFDTEKQRTLSILANHAGAAIEIARLRETALYASLVRAADLGYLASGIAHEFLSILQNIRVIEGQLRRTVTDIESHRCLDSLLKEYNKAVRTIDTFESFRHREVSDDPIDLGALVGNLTALSERRASDHNIKLECLLGKLPKVKIDPSLVQSIIVNLLRNAMDSVEDEPGDRRVQIEIRSVDEQHFEIAVRDNGRGLGPEVREEMFLPYFTTKGSKSMGIGLFLVQRIVRRLRGQIFVESRNEMGGATFRVVLPLVT